MGEATGETEWLDRAVYYITSIMRLATPQAGGYLGWKHAGVEYPLYEAYCWRFCPDVLRALEPFPAYADRHNQIKSFFEQHIFTKWWSRNAQNMHPVMHIGSHWCKMCVYLIINGSTSTIRSRAQGWLDTMDHTGLAHWGGKSLYHHMRPHPLDARAKFWPAYFDERDIKTGSDVSHGEALFTYVPDAIHAGYGLWTMADVDAMLRLVDIHWDGNTHWAYQMGPGTGTWAGKYAETGTLGQFSREFQKRLEDDAARVSNNTEKWGICALNAARLGAPYL